jgi:hypothetical protein
VPNERKTTPALEGRGLMKGGTTMPKYIRNRSGCAAKIDLQPISNKYLDVAGAAEYLCVSVACIRKMQVLKKLARYKVGRRVLVLVSDLDALVVADSPAEVDQ